MRKLQEFFFFLILTKLFYRFYLENRRRELRQTRQTRCLGKKCKTIGGGRLYKWLIVNKFSTLWVTPIQKKRNIFCGGKKKENLPWNVFLVSSRVFFFFSHHEKGSWQEKISILTIAQVSHEIHKKKKKFQRKKKRHNKIKKKKSVALFFSPDRIGFFFIISRACNLAFIFPGKTVSHMQ